MLRGEFLGNAVNDSLGQKVFRAIREDILSGRYRREEALKEVSIGQELGVSRTPVREALRQLELEGLARIIPNKGAYVVGFTAQDIRDIYEMRALLEGMCARRAARMATERQIEKMEEAACLADFHARKGNLAQVEECCRPFHAFSYKAGNSKMLEYALRNYYSYLRQAHRAILASEERAAQSLAEHKDVLAAVKAREEGRAEEAACAHVWHAMQYIDTYGWDKIS